MLTPFDGDGGALPPRPDWTRTDWLTAREDADDQVVTLLAPDRGELVLTETSLLGRALKSRGRLRFDAWSDFDDTSRFGGQLVATTWLRTAIDAEGYAWDSDDLAAPGELFGGEYYTGDVNLVAEVISHARGTARTGAGAAWVIDSSGESHFGPQATVALDANLLGPATAGFEIDWGAIGDDALFRWRAEFGWVWGLAEIRTGYDKVSLGDEKRAGWFASLLMRY
ncbi:hypothetical protein [Alienimonas chondri]|uniref:Uncharacterized protein n=1 Tax=Alienimonas chondri TaxID=2681879 RepID=A0ABX1VDA4_9PLAN|nr:hypothetical protein [Alienimonas chondri]NNJ25217.1 hypothetical protein [Alienimonas chondri]